jgi:pimeloyl-ACP methyl ester carboxylesterase
MAPVVFDNCFGWLHQPGGNETSAIAIVLCSGIKNDAMSGHRSYRLLADATARAGFPTLRFDYPGTGDSADPAPADELDNWSIWQKSIHTGIDWLRRQTGAQHIVLIGLRLGATLAATVAAQRDDVVGVAMLAPVLRGRSYINQLSIEAKMHDPAAQTNGALVLHELHLSKQTVEYIRSIDLRHIVLQPHSKIAVLVETNSPILQECLAAWRNRGADVVCGDFLGLEPMLRPVFMNHEAPINPHRITAWLRNTFPPIAGRSPREMLPPPARLVLDTCVETPLSFGPNDNLFGVLCRPRGCPEADLVVVIGNSSGDPHSGFARAATDLARRLAREGFASLRMDFAGIGDSRAQDDAPTHVFESDRRADFAAAIDALAARGYRRFALQGLCSGAYHAFQAAIADPRVGVLLLVNLPLFEWKMGAPVEYMSHIVESPAHFLQKIGRADLWAQFLRGELDLPNRLTTLGLGLVEKARSTFWRFTERLGFKPRPSPGRDGAQRLSHRARTLFLFAEGDAGIASLAREFGANTAPQGGALQIVPGLDHALTGRAMQAIAARHLITFLKQERLTYMTEDEVSDYDIAV